MWMNTVRPYFISLPLEGKGDRAAVDEVNDDLVL